MHRRPVALLAAMIVGLLLLAPGTAHADETPAPDTPSTAATPATPIDDFSDSGYSIAVTLRNSAELDAEGVATPVPGVTITVTDADGQLVGSSPTDEDGSVNIPIPGKGDYTVELDTSTLPEGATLSGAAETSKTVPVRLKAPKAVQFQIGVTGIQGPGFGTELAQSLVNGLKIGLIIALAGLGLSLIFGTTGLTNFAHGELITFGGIATFVFNRGFGLPVIAAGACAFVAAGVFGWAQDKAIWGPLRRRGTGIIAMMIVTIGFALLLRSIFQYTFGGSTRTLSEYVAQRSREYGSVLIADKEIGIMVVAIVVITITCIALARTRMGKAMRAVADNPALSASSGLRVDNVITNVWLLGTALSGLAGVLLAIDQQVKFDMGFKLLLLIFAAVTLGGLGTIWGALIGSLIIGIVSECGPLFGVPASIKDVGPLLILILILLVRPQGILGRAQRVG